MKYQKYSKDVMSIREFIDKIHETGRLLKEDMMAQSEEYTEEIPTQDKEQPLPGDEGGVPQDPEAAGMEYVDQIRKAAIEGIEAFVDNVDSPSYDFFKKVFMMADKVLSERNNEGEE